MEILLSFIEFTQFQQYLLDNMDVLDDDEINNIKLFKFPSNIPMSSIINENNMKQSDIEMDGNTLLRECKIKAHKLYNKYIKINSEFEINISSSERDNLSNVLDDLNNLLKLNMNLRDLFLLFNSSKDEMYTLQTYSFCRYQVENMTELSHDEESTTNKTQLSNISV